MFNWDKKIHGHNKPCKRSAWCLATALAIVNGTQLPPVPYEGTGKTRTPWRSADARIETIKRLLAIHN